MAIATIYKGAFFACLLGIVLAEKNSAETTVPLIEKSVTESPLIPIVLNTPTELPVIVSKDVDAKLYEAKLLEEQAKNAVYNFTATVVDGIMNSTQGRKETRNGYEVEGVYWYSDGFFRRTINYIANQDGYKIVSELVEPLGDGPVIDANGRADIYTNIGGHKSEYSITKNDIARYRNIKLLPATVTTVEKASTTAI